MIISKPNKKFNSRRKSKTIHNRKSNPKSRRKSKPTRNKKSKSSSRRKCKSTRNKKSKPCKKPRISKKYKRNTTRRKSSKSKTAVYNPYNYQPPKNKSFRNLIIFALLLAYFIFNSAFFVLRLNEPADLLLSAEEQNTSDNMFNVDKINQILESYNNLSDQEISKSLDNLDVRQIITKSDDQVVMPSASVNPDNKTIFAEIDLQGGATGQLLEVTKNFKMKRAPVFGVPTARGISVMGKWSRQKGDFKIENFFKISSDSEIIDNRFVSPPNNPALYNLFGEALIEQLTAMYNLNILNNMENDYGEFVIDLVELPPLPAGINPFIITEDWHQDGFPIAQRKDSETDSLTKSTRQVKGYNCTVCGGMSPYNILMTMTYDPKVTPANYRHITDDINQRKIITDIPPVISGNTVIADQNNDIQHAAFRTGSLVDRTLAMPRRTILVFITENGEYWEPYAGMNRVDI
jgi:hypothetical protein